MHLLASKHQSCLLLLLLLVVVLLIHGQKDHQLPEDGDKVQEQVHTVPDVILVSHLSFLDDELSVKQHESTHDGQTEVHMGLEDHDRANENVDQGHEHEDGEAGHQSASQEQVAPALGIQSTHGEAQEDDGGAQERCYNDAWVNGDDEIQARTKTNSCEESKASQDGQSLLLSLWSVGSHGQPANHAKRSQHGQDAGLEDPGDDMHIGSSCCHEHAHSQA